MIDDVDAVPVRSQSGADAIRLKAEAGYRQAFLVRCRARSLLVSLSFLAAAAGLAAMPAAALAGTTYYVDATRGRDSYSGTTPEVREADRRGPWRSLARVQAQQLMPGDSVLLKSGEKWRETLTVAASGSPGQPITIGAYGRGALPVLSGADVVRGWAPAGASLETYAAHLSTEPGIVHFGATRGTRRARLDLVAAAHDWYWADDTLYVHASTDLGLTVEAGARGAAIAVLGHSYITVQDLLLERTNGSGLYLHTSSNATSNIVVQRITSRHSRFAGMTFKNGHATLKTTSLLIAGNRVYGNGTSGINVSEGVNDIVIAANVSHDNNWSGDLYEAGIRVWANRKDARNLVVERNETYRNSFVGTGWQNGHGIWLDEVADGAVVRYNYSHDNGNVGIFIEHSHRARIYYNVVTNNGDASILLYRGVHHNEVYNNTVVGGGTGLRLAGDGAAGSVVGNSVMNNISVGPLGQRLMAGDGGENDGVKGFANRYAYNALGEERPGFVVWGYGVIESTYREWEAVYGGSTHSCEQAPGFSSRTDYRLRADSPCLWAGIDVGLLTDMLGVAIPPGAAPDVGAYQRAPAEGLWTPCGPAVLRGLVRDAC